MYSDLGNNQEHLAKKIVDVDKKTRAIDVSDDGKFLLYVPKEDKDKKYLVKIFDTETGKEIKNIEAKEELSDGIFSVHSDSTFNFQDNSLFTVLSVKKRNSVSDVLIYGLDDTSWKGLKNDNIEENGNIISNPKDGKIIFSSKMKKKNKKEQEQGIDKTNLYFSDYLYKSSDHTLTEDESLTIHAKKGKSHGISDLSANKRDIMAVAHGNKIKLYNLNTLKEVEDSELTDDNNITSLAMNPLGDQVITSHGELGDNGIGQGGTSFSIFKLNDLSKDVAGSGYGKKAVFDDRIPNMAFTLEYPNALGDFKDAFWNVNGLDSDWDDTNTAYSRKDFDLHSDWKRLDMIGMPRGGAMVLYGKDDGSSMLEWIGRNNNHTYEKTIDGKYKLFARWTRHGETLSAGLTAIPDGAASSMTSGSLDGSVGAITTLVSGQFDVGSVVKSCSFCAGDVSGNVYLTPLILKKTSSTGNFGSYKIIDYVTQSIGVSSRGLKSNVPLTWANGGRITSSDCYMGFWNGKIDAEDSNCKNRGAVVFDTSGTKNFVADCEINRVAATASDIKNLVTINHCSDDPTFEFAFNGYQRAYAIQFEAVTSSSDSISSFPPLYSQKLAVSPDQGMLAIISGVDNETDYSGDNAKKLPAVHFFDLRNNLYGQQTQIEGMLVDYREQKQSGAYGSSGWYEQDWPKETSNSLFLSIADNCKYTSGQISSWLGLTSTKDSWTSFNNYPGNYYFDDGNANTLGAMNKTKATANKRFIGYVSDTASYTYLQHMGTEGVRFFFNKSYIGGRQESNDVDAKFNPAMSIDLPGCGKGLLQYDHASNGGGNYSAVFLGTESADNSKLAKSGTSNDGSVVGNYYTLTNAAKNNGWVPLKNEYTHILNNYPYLMGKITAKTSEPIYLQVSDCFPIFSRDRALPYLYILDRGNRCFWIVMDKNPGPGLRLVKVNCNIGSDKNISRNMTISTDGQELLFGVDSIVRRYNIGSPNPSEIAATNGVYDAPTDSTKYLAYKGAITADSTVSFVATKPYNSYTTTDVGGSYIDVSDNVRAALGTYSIRLSDSAVVASGGIYVFDAATKRLGCYSPIEQKFTITTGDAFKELSLWAPITAYDNTIYVLGANEDTLTNKVQSYDLNTKNALVSIEETVNVVTTTSGYDDEYQVNWKHNSNTENYLDIDAGEFAQNAINQKICSAEEAFDGVTSGGKGWRTGKTDALSKAWIYYKNKSTNFKNVVNKLYISNDISDCGGAAEPEFDLKDFDFYGLISDSEETKITIASGVPLIKGESRQPVILDNNTAYYGFKLYCRNNFENRTLSSDSGVSVGLAELEMYRTGVKRLTPKLGALSGSQNSAATSLDWNGNTMKWTHASNVYTLKDIFIDNSESYNVVSGSAGWQNAKSYPAIAITLASPECVCAVRFANDSISSSYAFTKSIRLFGSNNDTLPAYDENVIPGEGDWESINFSQYNSNTFTCPDSVIAKNFITADTANTKKYKHYLFMVTGKSSTKALRMIGFEMFASGSGTAAAANTALTEDCLTGLQDDNRTAIKVCAGSACTTPFGIIYTGGQHSTDTANYATNTALLYWPHTVDRYDGSFYKYGIPRSLPGMKQRRFNHTSVWHKGCLYVIGGAIDGNHKVMNDDSGADNYIEYLTDLKDTYQTKFEWANIPANSFVFNDGTGGKVGIKSIAAFYSGACSFGDEIFIFGGATSGTLNGNTKNTAVAWNPETGRVRRLTNLPKPLAPCCAVPYGSKIYIFGQNPNESNTKLYIFEYTP